MLCFRFYVTYMWVLLLRFSLLQNNSKTIKHRGVNFCKNLIQLRKRRNTYYRYAYKNNLLTYLENLLQWHPRVRYIFLQSTEVVKFVELVSGIRPILYHVCKNVKNYVIKATSPIKLNKLLRVSYHLWLSLFCGVFRFFPNKAEKLALRKNWIKKKPNESMH